MRFESLFESIGHTPLVQLRGGSSITGAKLWAKLELMNPLAMKDRVARDIVLAAKAAGDLKDGGIIIESSSGTMAVGLALVGRALGYQVYIVTDPRIDPVTLAKLRALGAQVDIVQYMDEHGWQGARLKRVRQFLVDHPEAIWPRQYDNIYHPRAYTALAQELLADIGQVDVLVGSVGSGGSLCGTAHALRATNPDLFVVAVDAVGSVLFDQPDKPNRLQGGLGNSIVPSILDKSIIDQVHWLNDEEAFTATLRLAYDEQIFAGNSSGSAYWVARWISTQRPSECNVVVIFPDRGDRYYNTIYDPQYWEAHSILQVQLPLIPTQVPHDTVVTSWSYTNLQQVTKEPKHLK